MDPYVIITCRTQEQRSSVAAGRGTEPEWNETFLFNLSEGVSEISLKIMDSDKLNDDDFVGEASIHLEPLFADGNLPPTVYNVIKEQRYCGEIKVGLKFVPEEPRYTERSFGEEKFGGWKESSY